MATKATKKKKRGLYEDIVRFTPRGGGKSVEVELSPSKWALADEWVDSLRAQSLRVENVKDKDPIIYSIHTDAWYSSKMTSAACLLAAQESGLLPPSHISLESIFEMVNLFEIEIVTDDEDDQGDEENPTAAAPEA